MIGWSNVCVTLRLGLSGVIAFLSISLFNRSGIFLFLSGFLLSMSEFTTFASDLSPYMSGATTISMKSEKNKKAPSLTKGTKRMLVVPPFFLPTYIKSDEAQG